MCQSVSDGDILTYSSTSEDIDHVTNNFVFSKWQCFQNGELIFKGRRKNLAVCVENGRASSKSLKAYADTLSV